MDPGAVRASYADAEPRPFWLDRADAPEPAAPLEGEHEADLLVVGGGLTGLWAALLAAEGTPAGEVVLLEGERIAFGASGRNGGFIDASLTHGIENGVARWPDEMPELERLGPRELRRDQGGDRPPRDRRRLRGDRRALLRHRALPGRVHPGDRGDRARATAGTAEALDAEAARAEVNSPTYHGGRPRARRLRAGRPRPAGLGPGAAPRASAGVRPCTRARRSLACTRDGDGGAWPRTAHGQRRRARRAMLATSAFPPLVRAIRRYVVPVWDYVLVTRAAERRAARRRSAGSGARASPTWPTSSTTTA